MKMQFKKLFRKIRNFFFLKTRTEKQLHEIFHRRSMVEWNSNPTKKTEDVLRWVLCSELPKGVTVRFTKNPKFGDIQTNLPRFHSDDWNLFFETIQYVAPFKKYEVNNGFLNLWLNEDTLAHAIQRAIKKPFVDKVIYWLKRFKNML